MALEMAPGIIHLKEAATGRTVARGARGPARRPGDLAGLHPRRTRVVVVSGYDSAIHIWDLRAIRERLKEMKLTGIGPSFRPPRPGGPAAEPVTIEVPPGNLSSSRRSSGCAVNSKRTRTRRPLCNGLAWAYLTAPEALAAT